MQERKGEFHSSWPFFFLLLLFVVSSTTTPPPPPPPIQFWLLWNAIKANQQNGRDARLILLLRFEIFSCEEEESKRRALEFKEK